jgi:hypothetical protein
VRGPRAKKIFPSLLQSASAAVLFPGPTLSSRFGSPALPKAQDQGNGQIPRQSSTRNLVYHTVTHDLVGRHQVKWDGSLRHWNQIGIPFSSRSTYRGWTFCSAQRTDSGEEELVGFTLGTNRTLGDNMNAAAASRLLAVSS